MLYKAETLEYWILFPLKNGKLTPVLCDQVTQCLGSLTLSLVSPTSTNDIPTYEVKELRIAHNCMCPQHSACELRHMHLLLPKTD